MIACGRSPRVHAKARRERVLSLDVPDHPLQRVVKRERHQSREDGHGRLTIDRIGSPPARPGAEHRPSDAAKRTGSSTCSATSTAPVTRSKGSPVFSYTSRGIPRPLVNEGVLLNGHVGVEADESPAAVGEQPRQRAVAREDVASTAHVQPHRLGAHAGPRPVLRSDRRD